MINLGKEMAWITFRDDEFEIKWYPVLCPITKKHLEWDNITTMQYCRNHFNNDDNWIYFGIAPTSQMIQRHSVRDNM